MSIGKEAVLADSGWVGEKTGFFEYSDCCYHGWVAIAWEVSLTHVQKRTTMLKVWHEGIRRLLEGAAIEPFGSAAHIILKHARSLFIEAE